MKLTLTRTQETANCTFGVLDWDGLHFCVTLELPWFNNMNNISCISEGTYKCKRHSSQKFGEVWQVMDVPNRDEILIHAGNLPTDTHGCILVGANRGIVNNEKGIINSKETLRSLMDRTRNETELELEIKKNA